MVRMIDLDSVDTVYRSTTTVLTKKTLSLSSTSHTQKGPRDASEAVLAGGPLRVGEAATRVRDLEWPS